jgi:hypothetical protein
MIKLVILEQMLQLTIATNVISKVILTQLNEALNVQIVATPTLNMQTL